MSTYEVLRKKVLSYLSDDIYQRKIQIEQIARHYKLIKRPYKGIARRIKAEMSAVRGAFIFFYAIGVTYWVVSGHFVTSIRLYQQIFLGITLGVSADYLSDFVRFKYIYHQHGDAIEEIHSLYQFPLHGIPNIDST